MGLQALLFPGLVWQLSEPSPVDDFGDGQRRSDDVQACESEMRKVSALKWASGTTGDKNVTNGDRCCWINGGHKW